MEDYISNFQRLREAGKGMGLEGADLSGFVQGGMKPADGEWFGQLINLFRDPVYRKGTLEDALKYQKEQMKEAGKYKALFGLPGQIISAYSVPSQIRAQGAANIAQMMQDTTSRIPGLMDFQPVAVNYSPRSYFG